MAEEYLASLSGSFSETSLRSEAEETIDHRLPTYFNAQAQQYQRCLIRGRHPFSIPKNSELWHYSKVSEERKERIRRGRFVWDVISDHAWEEPSARILNNKKAKKLSILSRQYNEQAQFKQQQLKQAQAKGEDNEEKQHLLRGSLQSQLKAAMAAQDNMNIKLDYNKKGTINFGMNFIIVNFANEVLYVDRMGDLRTKQMKDIQPTDRLKFKLVDLSNPSNPRAIKFGQPVWFQCLDPADNADNSLQGGSVLTTKLFGPPQLDSVRFADTMSPLMTHNDGASGIHKALSAVFRDELQLNKRVIHNPDSSKDTSQFNSDNEKEEQEEGGDSSDEKTIDGEGGGSNKSVKTEANPGANHTNSSSGHTQHKHQFEDNLKAANICGHVSLSRIVEMRKDGTSFLPEGVMSDEKALRYNSRQSIHLGKWSIQPAKREDLQKALEDEDDDNEGNSNFNMNNPSGASLQNGFVSSLTPLVIQQDHYCLSTAPPVEYRHWPPNSSTIIRDSNRINSDLAEEYEKKYAKSLISNLNGDMVSSLVSNNRHSENRKKLYFMSSKSFEKNNTINNKRSSGLRNTESSKNAGSHGTTMLEDDQYGCVRKIVHRTAPYDFTVDRRCVWHFVLFEQFAESFVALSSKEKHAQKIMETATMALKLSKMNREGARKHINNCHIKIINDLSDQSFNGDLGLNHSMSNSTISAATLQSSKSTLLDNLPPLLGGEKFARSIREISYKTTQFADNAYLEERRKKEANLKQYFEEKMSEVLSREENMDQLLPSPSLFSSQSNSQDSFFGSVGFSPKFPKEEKAVKVFATEFDEEEEDDVDDDAESQADGKVKAHFVNQQNNSKGSNLRTILLTNPANIAAFRDLSAGEQLVSMHKTFAYYGRTSKAKTPRRKSTFSRPKAMAPAVAKKVEILQQEDEMIENIFSCRDRMQKRMEEDIENTNTVDT